jgi:hypothetical protein
MFYALISAPLFHVHDRDDDGHAGSLIHAHFPEDENVSHSEHAVETQHSHQHARWLDILVVNTPVPTTFQVVAEFSGPVTVPGPVVSRAVLSVQTLRSHSPPGRSDLPPRSPPTF